MTAVRSGDRLPRFNGGLPIDRGTDLGPGREIIPAQRNQPASRYPAYRSHYRPRTRAGRIAVALFLVLFALTQPPFVHGWANRVEPWLAGLPFLYTYLLVLYAALIAVLIWAAWRKL